MHIRVKGLVFGALAVAAIASAASGAPAVEATTARPPAVARVKAQTPATQASRDLAIAKDLDNVIATPVSADMSVAEQNAVTELAQAALALRNARDYRRQVNEKVAIAKLALTKKPGDLALQARATSMQAKFDEVNQSMSMLELMLQEALQRQQREYQMLSNIMKTQHDTTQSIINNMK